MEANISDGSLQAGMAGSVFGYPSKQQCVRFNCTVQYSAVFGIFRSKSAVPSSLTIFG